MSFNMPDKSISFFAVGWTKPHKIARVRLLRLVEVLCIGFNRVALEKVPDLVQPLLLVRPHGWEDDRRTRGRASRPRYGAT